MTSRKACHRRSAFLLMTQSYMAVANSGDAKILQSDLDKLQEWEKNWSMEFNPNKCEVIHITRSRNTCRNSYYMHGVALASVHSTKYLGITLTSDLRWNKHIDQITSKANRSLNFIKRNLQISNPALKTAAYNSLVRPILEYAPTIWDPHTKTNIDKIEMVQRRAARYVLHRHHNRSSVSSMLHFLGWTSLQQRREQARLCMMYKIHAGDVAINKNHYMTLAPLSILNTNGLRYVVPYSRCDYHLYSFFPRTIRSWNNLPSDIVEACSYNAFKSRLMVHYGTRPAPM